MQYSFAKMLEGEEGLAHWIVEHSDENGVLKESLPDEDSLGLMDSRFSGMRFVEGMLDGLIGDASEENGAESARVLLALFVEFAGKEELDDEFIDEILGRIYHFLMTHRTLSFIDEFIRAFLARIKDKESGELSSRLAHIVLTTAKQLLYKALHREVVKFAIALLGVFECEEDEIRLIMLFGRCDEFAIFVATALLRHDLHRLIFYLAKCVKGWGRIAYVERLDLEQFGEEAREVKEWLLCEGYDCEIGVDHIVLEVFEKTNPLAYIEEFGWSSGVFRGIGEMLESFCGLSKVHFDNYRDSVTLIARYVLEAKHRFARGECGEEPSLFVLSEPIPKRDFAILCKLRDYVENKYSDEIAFDSEVSEELLGVIRHFAFDAGIAWAELAREKPFDYDYKIIARELGIDLWEAQFSEALESSEFDSWWELARTNDERRLYKVCALAESRINLASREGEPSRASDINSLVGNSMDLESIAGSLQHCGAVVGGRIVKTLLFSPTTRSRNTALRVLEAWRDKGLDMPSEFVEYLRVAVDREIDEELKSRTQELFTHYNEAKSQRFARSSYEWCLQVWGEFGSSGIWVLWNKQKGKREFANVGYEALELPKELEWEFKQWQRLYDEYALSWYEKGASAFLRRLESAFKEEGIELARKLKKHFRGKAYVEAYIDGGLREVLYLRVESNHTCSLIDEEGMCFGIEGLDEEDALYGICLSDETQELGRELETWAQEYFEEECRYYHGKEGECDEENLARLSKQGRELAQRLQALMPCYVVVDYYALEIESSAKSC